MTSHYNVVAHVIKINTVKRGVIAVSRRFLYLSIALILKQGLAVFGHPVIAVHVLYINMFYYMWVISSTKKHFA